MLGQTGPMRESIKCRECSQLFTPAYDNDHLCNTCFRLEDDPPWEDGGDMVSVPPKSDWKNITIEIGNQAAGKRKKN